MHRLRFVFMLALFWLQAHMFHQQSRSSDSAVSSHSDISRQTKLRKRSASHTPLRSSELRLASSRRSQRFPLQWAYLDTALQIHRRWFDLSPCPHCNPLASEHPSRTHYRVFLSLIRCWSTCQLRSWHYSSHLCQLTTSQRRYHLANHLQVAYHRHSNDFSDREKCYLATTRNHWWPLIHFAKA